MQGSAAISRRIEGIRMTAVADLQEARLIKAKSLAGRDAEQAGPSSGLFGALASTVRGRLALLRRPAPCFADSGRTRVLTRAHLINKRPLLRRGLFVYWRRVSPAFSQQDL